LPGGKSAALSAITVALGGKATSTGRASGLKSFIKSGERCASILFLEIILTVFESAAEVSVTIKNGGLEPYRPEVYGESITVTRHFTQAGNASYKIKNKLGRTVSTTRDELSAILDHYLIDVDNPMNILTQGTYIDDDY
jgi:chromosome segregation ATPase